MNRFANALSRTWDPCVLQATDWLLRSIMTEYRLDHVAFRHRPLGENLVARTKYFRTEIKDCWDDGVARLSDSLFDHLPLVIPKIEQQRGRGVLVAQYWPAQAWFVGLCALTSWLSVLHRDIEDAPLLREHRERDQCSLVVTEAAFRSSGEKRLGIL